MTNTLSRVAAIAGATAYVASAAHQIFRGTRHTGLPVDDFSWTTAISYAALTALSLALLTDRRWVWWANLVVAALVYLQAPFAYYPWVYSSRPLILWDWLEGTWFTALLFVVALCAIARLAGLTLSRPAGPIQGDTGRAASDERAQQPAGLRRRTRV